MLYIFDVANGKMLTLDAKLSSETVTRVKEALENTCNVPESQQVLLMSGGVVLESDIHISSYSTGTDTNPVFLFNKNVTVTKNNNINGYSKFNGELSAELDQHLSESQTMPANYKTVVGRTQIAQSFYEAARQTARVCESLVRDQHFQQQGWSAVVAHLEDITHAGQTNLVKLLENFETYMNNHQEFTETLNELKRDMQLLANLPVLPALQESHEEQQQSLLNWISAKRLEQVGEQCTRGLKRFDRRQVHLLKSEFEITLEMANEKNLKEIKRVCERLFTLEEMIKDVKHLVADQSRIAEYFRQDHDRLARTRDENIVADKCRLHHDFLSLMQQNDNQLRDIFRRIVISKEKLSSSIQRRLQRIIEVETKLLEVNDRVIMYSNSLSCHCRELELLKQVHTAPELYVDSVTEVVRRRHFSKAFDEWATRIANQMRKVYEDEIERRMKFQERFDGHFLEQLFIGFRDAPPRFAIDAPPKFDTRLPNLTEDDVKIVMDLPNVEFNVELPDVGNLKIN